MNRYIPRKFNFYDKETLSGNICEILGGRPTCAIGERGCIIFGDESGNIVITDRSLVFYKKHKAFSGSVVHLSHIRVLLDSPTEYLVAVGNDNGSEASTITSTPSYSIRVFLASDLTVTKSYIPLAPYLAHMNSKSPALPPDHQNILTSFSCSSDGIVACFGFEDGGIMTLFNILDQGPETGSAPPSTNPLPKLPLHVVASLTQSSSSSSPIMSLESVILIPPFSHRHPVLALYLTDSRPFGSAGRGLLNNQQMLAQLQNVRLFATYDTYRETGSRSITYNAAVLSLDVCGSSSVASNHGRISILDDLSISKSLSTSRVQPFHQPTSRGCVTMQQFSSGSFQAGGNAVLALARDEGIVTYTPDDKASTFAFEGPKQFISYFGDLLLISGPDIGSANGMESMTSELQSGSGLSYDLTVYDTRNKLIAFSSHLPPGSEVLFVLPDVHRIGQNELEGVDEDSDEIVEFVVITNTYFVIRLRELTKRIKIATLKKKKNYPVAISLAASDSGSGSRTGSSFLLAELYKEYGDLLLSKNEFESAISQYTHTIGFVQPSYVISKFLDVQRVHFLLPYLDRLHHQSLHGASGVEGQYESHTSLLLSCYLRQLQQQPQEADSDALGDDKKRSHESSNARVKLLEFLGLGDPQDRPSDSKHADAILVPTAVFDVDHVIAMLHRTRQWEIARMLAEKNEKYAWVMKLMVDEIDELKMNESVAADSLLKSRNLALQLISYVAYQIIPNVTTPEFVKLMNQFGHSLFMIAPNETTAILIQVSCPSMELDGKSASDSKKQAYSTSLLPIGAASMRILPIGEKLKKRLIKAVSKHSDRGEHETKDNSLSAGSVVGLPASQDPGVSSISSSLHFAKPTSDHFLHIFLSNPSAKYEHLELYLETCFRNDKKLTESSCHALLQITITHHESLRNQQSVSSTDAQAISFKLKSLEERIETLLDSPGVLYNPAFTLTLLMSALPHSNSNGRPLRRAVVRLLERWPTVQPSNNLAAASSQTITGEATSSMMILLQLADRYTELRDVRGVERLLRLCAGTRGDSDFFIEILRKVVISCSLSTGESFVSKEVDDDDDDDDDNEPVSRYSKKPIVERDAAPDKWGFLKAVMDRLPDIFGTMDAGSSSSINSATSAQGSDVPSIVAIQPLQIIEVLTNMGRSKDEDIVPLPTASQVPLRLALPLINRHLSLMRLEIDGTNRDISRLRAANETVDKELFAFRTTARCLQSTKCAQSQLPLEPPLIHFGCGHSYNLNMLHSTVPSSGSRQVQQYQCMYCYKEHQKWEEIRRLQLSKLDDQESFFKELTLAGDSCVSGGGFRVVCDYFGKALFSQE